MLARVASFLAVLAATAFTQGASAAPLLNLYFPSPTVLQGDPIQLAIDIFDGDSTGITGGVIGPLSLTYPPGIVNSGISYNSCGTAVAVPGDNSFSASGISVGRDGVCSIVLELSASSVGFYTFNFASGGFVGSSGGNVGAATATVGIALPAIVRNTNDSGPDSLRAAIENMNAMCMYMDITFAIDGVGPHTIAPLTPLPALTCYGVGIDGLSQPDAHGADDAVGPDQNNADLRIVLDGSSCPGCDGLTIAADTAVTIRGLVIRSFGGAGIRSFGELSASHNFIGVDPDGKTAHGNATGIAGETGSTLLIDGGNLITGNDIGLLAADSAQVQNSLIGGDRDGNPGIGNGVGFRSNVDGAYFIHGNYIRHNRGPGIVMPYGALGDVTDNSIWGNSGTGIDIGDDGFTPPSETTPYPFNPPFITSAVGNSSGTTIIGYVKTAPNRNVYLEFYDNPGPPVPGITEGHRARVAGWVTTDATGYANFNVNTNDSGGLAYVSGIASVDMCGEGCLKSSEFSVTVPVTLPVSRWVVTNTNDSGPGSLRDALEYSTTGACASKRASGAKLSSTTTISFNIPGAGLHNIQPLTPLPATDCSGLVIDGFTQPGSKPNQASVGDDAIRLIMINGGFVSPRTADGLVLAGQDMVVRGLIINGFAGGAGILSTATAGVGPRIIGNVIGTNAAASSPLANLWGIAVAGESPGKLTVGTLDPADRNVISGNGTGIALVIGDSHLISNNLIGLDVSGDRPMPNITGIMASGVTNLTITGNSISGNSANGVELDNSTGTSFSGNNVGTTAQGIGAVPNRGHGIVFGAAAFGRVSTENTIAFNAGHGISVLSSGVSIRSNSIHSNGGQGIELGTGGVSPTNDSCDADGGGNNLQNYPVITSVAIFSDYMTVSGTFDSTGGRTFMLEFFENSGVANPGFRAGRFLLGAGEVATTLTPSCATPFSFNLPAVIAPGSLVTATATDLATGDTSGFSDAVAATIPGPGVDVSPASLSFGGQVVNTSSPAQQVTIANSGTTPLAISSINVGSHFSFTTTCGSSLAIGASCTVDVTFTPTVVAPIATALLVATDAPGSPHRVDVSGIGMAAPAPLVTLSPSSLAFSSQLIGTPSAQQAVTLTNSGTARLAISTISVTGDFSHADSCPALLNVGASCTINVTFTPTAAGPRSGTLSVASNAAGTPHTLSLTGTGVTPAPIASITPGTLSFAARTVSTTSTAQTITLANTGTLALAIASIRISGDFAFTSACGATLATGSSCAIDVTFTPLVVGNRSGTLTITDNAAGSPHTVALSGTGLSASAPVADVSPTTLDFPAQPVGSESGTETVRVTNSGNAPLTFSAIGVSGEFAIVTVAGATNCPIPLAPAAFCDIGVSFRPTAFNLRVGSLAIATNAGVVNVRLVGTGFVPAPAQLSVPASLAFGTQAVGTHGAGLAVPLQNTSASLATITELSASGDFAVSDTCATIAAGATCSPLVTFQPSAVGPRTGTLTVRTLRDVNPYLVNLSGTGEDRRDPVLQLSATGIGFGNTFMGLPITRDLAVRNTGTAPLVITSILTRGAFFTDTSCITTLPPGAACTVRVSFLASLPGSQGATLDIFSNASGSPHHVLLSGTGCFVPTPSRIRLGGVLCGP